MTKRRFEQYQRTAGDVRKYIGPTWESRTLCATAELKAECRQPSAPGGPTIDSMSRFGSQYHVSRSTGVCAHSGEAMQPGTPCIAALCERPDDESFDRLDFSIASWDAGARPAGLFSYWKTNVPAPDGRQRMLVDDDVLLDLFERLAEDERPSRRGFRFVLGLILMRKKLLKLVGRREPTADQLERWLLVRRGSEAGEAPPMELINPNLAESDIRDITDQLSEVLNSEL